MADGLPPDHNDHNREALGSVLQRTGIPTRYRGILMRSRLEARWAAFFDQLHWRWAYEPHDLCGYIPDFVLEFEAGHVLVEVKPRHEDLALAQSKIECSGWDKEAIVVLEAETPEIGQLMEVHGGEPAWSTAVLFWCISCGFASIRSADLSWRCRHCGCADGNAHVGSFNPRKAWVAAGNRVQWRAPQ